MGIQSGSEHILHDVFNRNETQSDILYAVEEIHNSGVFWCTYDFILQHPFESIEDLKETYYLVKQFAEPFELQLHGLNFLPGSDIVQMALNQGIYSQDELNSIMFGSMEEQYSYIGSGNTSLESDLWYKLIYCLQFKSLKKKAASFEENKFIV